MESARLSPASSEASRTPELRAQALAAFDCPVIAEAPKNPDPRGDCELSALPEALRIVRGRTLQIIGSGIEEPGSHSLFLELALLETAAALRLLAEDRGRIALW